MTQEIQKEATPIPGSRRFHILAATTIPGDVANLDGLMLVTNQVDRQVAALLVDAAAASPNARKGTPLQQVGNLYAAVIDVERLKSLRVAPPSNQQAFHATFCIRACDKMWLDPKYRVSIW